MTNLREIYFDNNQLTVIEKNSFDGLKEHLRVLVLAVNKLTTPSLESFRFLTNLWHLDIARNNYDDYPNAFANLINLQFLKIDAIRYRFDNKIENMKKLEVFELTPSNIDMQLTLENDTFVGLGNLEIKTLSLDLRTDVKGPIGIDVLKPFRFIKNLFISINGGHDIRDILKMLHGIRHRSLDYMNLAYDKMEGDRSLDLRANDVQYLLNICVKSIDLTRNNIYHFPFLESLNTNFSNCLEKLVYAGNNGLLSDSEVLGIASFPVLKYIDLSISPSLMRNTIIIVCLHQKDFIPGEPIASEILRCVESSRKTVFVITRNFLASKWSMMEMDIARHHAFNDDNDTIIVILKEDIPLHEMPLSLRKIWWRIVCLKYPQNSSRFEQEVFEKRLSDAFLLKT
ncbi:hypothetical protein FSP39_000545 [Pinctada imbricata]|uniref:TIR domain-containing protein n=1 Tax=Pinctada imbricata TaxID=66713 RepID=A0AA89BQC3_PINIB|nr:hypothetical protein FSP39_000545 [Pinctada imbricata]